MSTSATIAPIPETRKPSFSEWSSAHSYFLLAAATLLCLLPFSGGAFHVDDPLFVWSAKQITKHPLDPYGFRLVWDNYSEPMFEVTKNPPLACYYAALIGSIAGWSERALHLGFLLPALALVLGTYRLSLRFTRLPLLAAGATLMTPGILVSATSVMCDTMMLAFWIWSAILWIEGLDSNKPAYLAGSSFLLALAALTKYFGISLLPLLLVYSIVRKRGLGLWVLYLVIPLGFLGGYQFWTAEKYGHGMFSQAMDFARSERQINGGVSFSANAIVGLAFAGGCSLSALFLFPFVWRWKKLVSALLFGLFCSVIVGHEWIGLGHYTAAVHEGFRTGGVTFELQLALLTVTGIAVLGLALTELRDWRNPESSFLGLWIAGTYFFAAFANWSANARSVMPLIPAAGILLARRIDKLDFHPTSQLKRKLALAVLFSGAISVWVAQADSEWANSARRAAEFIHQQNQDTNHTVWFYGHWGFQYYMQSWGAQPVDAFSSKINALDTVVVPESNATVYPAPPAEIVGSSGLLQIKLEQPISTMRWRVGAGFYSAFYGPMPFLFVPAQTERYYMFHLVKPLHVRLSSTSGN